MYDILYDALTRAGTVEKEALLKALLETKIETVFGSVEFNEGQCMQIPAIATQWVPGGDYNFEKVVVSSQTFPAIPEFEPFVIPDTTQK